MTDFDTIWRQQDEIRTVVDAAIGCGIWDIRYNGKREAIELELICHLDDDAISELICQFPMACDYDGEGGKGTKFVFFL